MSCTLSHVLRHVLALSCSLPLLLCLLLRTPEERGKFTDMDRLTVKAASYLGDASFALTGSLAAGTEGMDLFGGVVVGFVTALGGGTVRDVFLGRLPVFWAVAYDEFLIVLFTSLGAYFLWPWLSHLLDLSTGDEWLFWTDTIGLGVFAAFGAYTAIEASDDLTFGACAVAGVFTATFGGLTRDLLCQKPPRILYAQREVYALPALGGGLACTAVLRLLSPTLVAEAIYLGAWVTIELRVLAINGGWRLPTFPADRVHAPSGLYNMRKSRTMAFLEDTLGLLLTPSPHNGGGGCPGMPNSITEREEECDD